MEYPSVVKMLAFNNAKDQVKLGIKKAGGRLSDYPRKEIDKAARQLVQNRPEMLKEALGEIIIELVKILASTEGEGK